MKGDMSHSGAVPCGSGARQCNAMRCCMMLCPHGYLVLGPVTEFHAASLLSPFMVIDK